MVGQCAGLWHRERWVAERSCSFRSLGAMAVLQLFFLACDANRGEAAGAREPDRGDAHAAGRHVERR